MGLQNSSFRSRLLNSSRSWKWRKQQLQLQFGSGIEKSMQCQWYCKCSSTILMAIPLVLISLFLTLGTMLSFPPNTHSRHSLCLTVHGVDNSSILLFRRWSIHGTMWRKICSLNLVNRFSWLIIKGLTEDWFLLLLILDFVLGLRVLPFCCRIDQDDEKEYGPIQQEEEEVNVKAAKSV